MTEHDEKANSRGIHEAAERRFFLRLAAVWTMGIGVICVIGLYYIRHDHLAATISHARGAYRKDVIYRLWAAQRGGVYVPPSALTPPNPYLAQVPDRDVVTTTGKQLTLVNPAYMTRMVHELGTREFGFIGRIIGIRPLNPVNAPDPWEAEALRRLAAGAKEVSEVTTLDGRPHLRFMGPLAVQPPCLRCHGDEGLKIGDVRGGISFSLPVEPIWSVLTTPHGMISLAGIGVIWGIGMGGLYTGQRVRKRHLQEQRQAASAVKLSDSRYRLIVDTAQEGIGTFDDEFRLGLCNVHLAAMLGCQTSELVGRRLDDFVFDGDLHLHREQLATWLHNQSEHFELRLRRLDGAEVWAIVSAQPLRDDTGTFSGFFAMFTDITERKRMEEEIRNSLHEKEVLLKEIHHRVKNNLQIISSLLNLQATHTGNQELAPLLRESQNRVRTMALIHEKLYRSDNLAWIDFGVYLRELANSLFRSYREQAGRVRLNIHAEPITLGIDTAVPCGLLVNELVSNALKYAFPDGREGELRIRLTRNEDATCTLVVADTGVGLPEGFDIRESATLGMELIRSLTKQLDGHLEVDRDGGTSFSITFKRHE